MSKIIMNNVAKNQDLESHWARRQYKRYATQIRTFEINFSLHFWSRLFMPYKNSSIFRLYYDFTWYFAIGEKKKNDQKKNQWKT